MNKKILDDRIVEYTGLLKNPDKIINDIYDVCKKYSLKFAESTINNYQIDKDKVSSTAFWLHASPKDIEISTTFPNEKFEINSYIDKEVSEAVFDYIDNYDVKIKQKERWGMVRYEKDQFITWHQDGPDPKDNPNGRKLSFVLYLNDNYENGGIQFRDYIGGEEYKPTAGSLLIFPSYPQYSHRVIPVSSGTKYVNISFAI